MLQSALIVIMLRLTLKWESKQVICMLSKLSMNNAQKYEYDSEENISLIVARRKVMRSVQHSSRVYSPLTWTPWNTSCSSRSWSACVRQRTSCWWNCHVTSLWAALFHSAKVPWVSKTFITGCLQLLEILEISWNLKTLLEILEISWNLNGPPGNFCVMIENWGCGIVCALKNAI